MTRHSHISRPAREPLHVCVRLVLEVSLGLWALALLGIHIIARIIA